MSRVVIVGFGVVVAVAAFFASTSSVEASSHREAPNVTRTPKVDGTDFYLFRSYEPGRDGFVTVVANYLPLQDPYGGPNYFTLDPEALYEIHLENSGNAVEDLTFQFRFQNNLRDITLPIGNVGDQRMVSIPLVNSGSIAPGQTNNLNVTESYTVSLVRGARRGPKVVTVTNMENGSGAFVKPVDNIGDKSIPNYAAYAATHIYNINIPGATPNAPSLQGRMFVGQRKDPFVVNLGETFDLVNTNPLGAENGRPDTLSDKNITSIILELPIALVTNNGANPVIGGWTSASLPRGRAIGGPGNSGSSPNTRAGPWVQQSRLGSPLVNEVVIGLKDKDSFNMSEPRNDGQFLTYVTHPTLPALLQILFNVQAPTLFPRADLVQAFLTGVPGLNSNGATGEMLRLNTATPVTPRGLQNRLGVIAADNAGYPNGRRPGDDVVDISLRAVMGVLLPQSSAPAGQLAFTDGAFIDDSFFTENFPYLLTPLPGAGVGAPQ